ncbi:hypothetical protein SNEBB_006341 [Seison nebaliae]|nr:hypothetical protein SNEBB_006341 [Seison nebaliae]
MFRFKKRGITHIVVDYLNCLAGGVFFGTLFLHMLNESREALNDVINEVGKSKKLSYQEFPMAELIMGCSYFFLFASDELISLIYESKKSSEKFLELENNDNKNTSIDVEQQQMKLRVLSLLFALSLHMLFEGAAIGLNKDLEVAGMLLLAIGFHKTILGFSIGIEAFVAFANNKSNNLPKKSIEQLIRPEETEPLFLNDQEKNGRIGIGSIHPSDASSDSTEKSFVMKPDKSRSRASHFVDHDHNQYQPDGSCLTNTTDNSYLSMEEEKRLKLSTFLAYESKESSDQYENFNYSVATAILKCIACGTFFYVTFNEIIFNQFQHRHQRTEHRLLKTPNCSINYKLSAIGNANKMKLKNSNDEIKLPLACYRNYINKESSIHVTLFRKESDRNQVEIIGSVDNPPNNVHKCFNGKFKIIPRFVSRSKRAIDSSSWKSYVGLKDDEQFLQYYNDYVQEKNLQELFIQRNISYHSNETIQMGRMFQTPRRDGNGSFTNSFFYSDSQQTDEFLKKMQYPSNITVVTIRMAVAVAYDLYEQFFEWFGLSHDLNNKKDIELAHLYIAFYYSHLVESMNIRYHYSFMDDPNLRFNIVLSGIIFPKSSYDTPWDNSNRYSDEKTKIYENRPTINASKAIDAMRDFYNYRLSNKFDFILGTTNKNLFHPIGLDAQRADNRGIAFLSSICSNRSYALIEDWGGLFSAISAAHELGHVLGAVHDGEEDGRGISKKCSASDNYIMTPIRGQFDNKLNQWKFSECSIAIIKKNLLNGEKKLKSNLGCLKLMDTEDTSVAHYEVKDELENEFLSATQQCQQYYNSESLYCQGVNLNICTDLACAQYANSTDCMYSKGVGAAIGTYCGVGRVCSMGKCIEKKNNSNLNSCVWGDDAINTNLLRKYDISFPHQHMNCRRTLNMIIRHGYDGFYACRKTVLRKICCGTCENYLKETCVDDNFLCQNLTISLRDRCNTTFLETNNISCNYTCGNCSRGKYAVAADDACFSIKCLNGGSCFSTNNGRVAKCQCTEDYFGNFCQYEYGCSSRNNPCHRDETCLVSSFSSTICKAIDKNTGIFTLVPQIATYFHHFIQHYSFTTSSKQLLTSSSNSSNNNQKTTTPHHEGDNNENATPFFTTNKLHNMTQHSGRILTTKSTIVHVQEDEEEDIGRQIIDSGTTSSVTAQSTVDGTLTSGITEDVTQIFGSSTVATNIASEDTATSITEFTGDTSSEVENTNTSNDLSTETIGSSTEGISGTKDEGLSSTIENQLTSDGTTDFISPSLGTEEGSTVNTFSVENLSTTNEGVTETIPLTSNSQTGITSESETDIISTSSATEQPSTENTDVTESLSTGSSETSPFDISTMNEGTLLPTTESSTEITTGDETELTVNTFSIENVDSGISESSTEKMSTTNGGILVSSTESAFEQTMISAGQTEVVSESETVESSTNTNKDEGLSTINTDIITESLTSNTESETTSKITDIPSTIMMTSEMDTKPTSDTNEEISEASTILNESQGTTFSMTSNPEKSTMSMTDSPTVSNLISTIGGTLETSENIETSSGNDLSTEVGSSAGVETSTISLNSQSNSIGEEGTFSTEQQSISTVVPVVEVTTGLETTVGVITETNNKNECSQKCKNGICEVTENPNIYNCICYYGFEGANCENAIKSCTKSCQNGGTCRKDNGIELCQCTIDFTGSNCETGKCSSIFCQNEGTCKIIDNSPVCLCEDKFFGKECQYQICGRKMCHNGHCSPEGKCVCTKGYYGESCQLSMCDVFPCLNGGFCKITFVGPFCECTSEFTGVNCELPANKPVACLNDGRLNADGTCICLPQFIGHRCEKKNYCYQYCLNDGRCIIVNDSPKCLCTTGFSGIRCETPNVKRDITCETLLTCLNGGTCVLEETGFQNNMRAYCKCPNEFTGDYCEGNTKSTTTNPTTTTTATTGKERCRVTCTNHVSCEGFVCECKPSYYGPLCQIRRCSSGELESCERATLRSVDSAISHQEFCHFNDQIKTLMCQCDNYYYITSNSNCSPGTTTSVTSRTSLVSISSTLSTKDLNNSENRIVVDTTPCNTIKCQNGGVCRLETKMADEITQHAFCVCPFGWYGLLCEKFNQCSKLDCGNHGSCYVGIDGHAKCRCDLQYKGLLCETMQPDLNPASPHFIDCERTPCLNGGRCIDDDPPRCFCHPSFDGKRCEIFFDPCKNFICNNGGQCYTSDDGQAKCQCHNGYYGPCCQFITKLEPSTATSCNRINCGVNRQCVVSESYEVKCECNEGYVGDNCDIMKQHRHCTTAELMTSPCMNGGSCISYGSGTYCLCYSDYKGSRCETFVLDAHCPNNPCQNNGHYVKRNGKCVCECRKEFEGDLCEINLTIKIVCQPHYCKNGGRCIMKDNYEPQCICTPEYTGFACEFYTQHRTCSIIESNRSPCQNGGSCISYGSGTYCLCFPDTSGTNCETILHHKQCSPNICQNHGRYVMTHHKCRCECPQKYEGEKCEKARTNIQSCSPNPCENNGNCIIIQNSLTCQCQPRFTGIFCETVLPHFTNACDSNPCQNKGICVTTDGQTYTCKCLPSWDGKLCERMLATATGECAVAPTICLNGGTCEMIDNKFNCLCPSQFSGIFCGKENSINKCEDRFTNCQLIIQANLCESVMSFRSRQLFGHELCRNSCNRC